MSATVYLITGTNRGIGLALTTELASRPDAIVFAGARNPAQASDLKALADAHPGRIHVVNVVSGDRANNDAAIQEIEKVAGRLDVVIANAGIGSDLDPALEVKPETMVDLYKVNTIGPLVLFQAAHRLLHKSSQPKFVTLSSGLGSIALASQLAIDSYAYSASKTAVNWIMCKLHHDFPDFVIFPISPGVVATDMAQTEPSDDPDYAAFQKAYPAITPQESARAILEQVNVATRETHGGKFVDYTGLGKWAW